MECQALNAAESDLESLEAGCVHRPCLSTSKRRIQPVREVNRGGMVGEVPKVGVEPTLRLKGTGF